MNLKGFERQACCCVSDTEKAIGQISHFGTIGPTGRWNETDESLAYIAHQVHSTQKALLPFRSGQRLALHQQITARPTQQHRLLFLAIDPVEGGDSPFAGSLIARLRRVPEVDMATARARVAIHELDRCRRATGRRLLVHRNTANETHRQHKTDRNSETKYIIHRLKPWHCVDR